MSAYENFNAALLLLTAGVVFWYAIETHRLRKAAQSQLEVTHLPILTLRYGGVYSQKQDAYGSGRMPGVNVVNCGFGPAFDVQLADWVNGEVVCKFRPIPLLRAGEESGFVGEYFIEGEPFNDIAPDGRLLLAYFLSQDENQSQPFRIHAEVTYKNAYARTYISKYLITFDRTDQTIFTLFQGLSNK